MTHEESAKMAGYIWSILKSRLPVLMSWGVDLDTMKVMDGGLQFHVQGFLLTGNVVIVYNEGTDYFDVTQDSIVKDQNLNKMLILFRF